MKCPKCKKDNKKKAVKCRHCGANLVIEEWQPSWKWNLKTLIIIYGVLIVLYVLARIIL